MPNPERPGPAKLRQRARIALVIGLAALAASLLGLARFLDHGTLTLWPGHAGVPGREAVAILLGVGATAVGFCIYAGLLWWGARRMAEDPGDP